MAQILTTELLVPD